jgi:putative ABC transport system permease protein
MIKNYFKIAFRNLSRNKAFSFINIFGLAIGLATCLLIMLYEFSELGYDSQNKDADRLYRIASASDLRKGLGSNISAHSLGLKNRYAGDRGCDPASQVSYA